MPLNWHWVKLAPAPPPSSAMPVPVAAPLLEMKLLLYTKAEEPCVGWGTRVGGRVGAWVCGRVREEGEGEGRGVRLEVEGGGAGGGGVERLPHWQTCKQSNLCCRLGLACGQAGCAPPLKSAPPPAPRPEGISQQVAINARACDKQWPFAWNGMCCCGPGATVSSGWS